MSKAQRDQVKVRQSLVEALRFGRMYPVGWQEKAKLKRWAKLSKQGRK
jgi:hypothetical protein